MSIVIYNESVTWLKIPDTRLVSEIDTKLSDKAVGRLYQPGSRTIRGISNLQ